MTKPRSPNKPLAIGDFVEHTSTGETGYIESFFTTKKKHLGAVVNGKQVNASQLVQVPTEAEIEERRQEQFREHLKRVDQKHGTGPITKSEYLTREW